MKKHLPRIEACLTKTCSFIKVKHAASAYHPVLTRNSRVGGPSIFEPKKIRLSIARMVKNGPYNEVWGGGVGL